MKEQDRDETKKLRASFSRAWTWCVLAGGIGGMIGIGWGLALFAVQAAVPQVAYMVGVGLLVAGSFAKLFALEARDDSIKNLPTEGLAALRLKLDEHHGPDPRYETAGQRTAGWAYDDERWGPS